MDARIKNQTSQLRYLLDALNSHYVAFIDLLNNEREALLSSDCNLVNQISEKKSDLLTEIRATELKRIRISQEILAELGEPIKSDMTLKAMIENLPLEVRNSLQQVGATLYQNMLAVANLNRENGVLANSALKFLNKAMTNIKEVLAGKANYVRRGGLQFQSPQLAGNFISKEV